VYPFSYVLLLLAPYGRSQTYMAYHQFCASPEPSPCG